MKKLYIKPTIRIPEFEMESLLVTFSVRTFNWKEIPQDNSIGVEGETEEYGFGGSLQEGNTSSDGYTWDGLDWL